MPEIVLTNDGSMSVKADHWDEQYHSVHGAIQESMHVFIEAGLKEKWKLQNSLSVLEIGFGTGLNALLTLLEANHAKKYVHYCSLEKFPLPESIHEQLNYDKMIEAEQNSLWYREIYQCTWEKEHPISNYFTLKKQQMQLEDCTFNNQFDVIYFDAFSPTSQPELWTNSIFQLMYNALKNDGILVTYCAKGIVKRTIKSVGFSLETLQGPKGKREMIRARK